MPDIDRKNKTVLTEKIDELESLLNGQTAAPGNRVESRSGIPILDDLFIPEDYADYPEPPHADEPVQGLEQIADELESKLSQELDEIVSLLKVNMKESILNELQALLKDQARKKTGA